MITVISQLIKEQITSGVYHGASLALYQDGQWQDYYFGTIDGKEPIQKGLVYDLASVSKVVGVGTLCIDLYKSGALDLDRSVQSYYPAFGNSETTVRQLLTHTSGLNPYIPNRNQLDAFQLKSAMLELSLEDNRNFRYSDVNFIILGFMLEEMFGKTLNQIFSEKIFQPLGMSQTSFGPRKEAVPTLKNHRDGIVHDPKAQVLKEDTGSAGLFSTLEDLQLFMDFYLNWEMSKELFRDYSHNNASRSLAWRLKDGWLDHTGYTGPFIMFNENKEAVIFMTNRTFEKDERDQWIKDRDRLMDCIQVEMAKNL